MAWITTRPPTIFWVSHPPLMRSQEFNLITQNASAEFGNYNGGIINATIKSGTNSFTATCLNSSATTFSTPISGRTV